MIRGVPFYQLEPVAPTTSSPAPASVQAVDRPSWARGLPAHRDLVYARDLGAATLVVVLGLYLAVRAVRDPGAALAAIRSRAGL